MRTSKWPSLAVVGILSAGLAGCQMHYRAETVLHSDGSVERAIYQDPAKTPEAAKRPELWEKIVAAPPPPQLEKRGWSGSIRQLPGPDSTDGRSYFAAWGRFRSLQDIPEHVIIKADGELPSPEGKLERNYVRTDYVFVVEHRWRETLTDIVKFNDMQKARHELADLLTNAGEHVFKEWIGKDYDSTELFKWLRTEGEAWLAEVTDFAFIYCAARKGTVRDDVFWKEVAAISARYDLTLELPDKAKDEDWERAFRDLFIRKLCQYVRRKDGQDVDRATAAGWVDQIMKGRNEEEPATPLEKAIDKVLEQDYGGKESFRKRWDMLVYRIGGLHAPGFLVGRSFDYAMAMPGEIVETNGVILSNNRVRWRFDAVEAYPLGYEMACRSLEPHVQAQSELLNGQPLASREQMLEYLSLATQEKQLVAALHQCRETKQMGPLYEYRQSVISMGRLPLVDRVLKMLNLPPEAPPARTSSALLLISLAVTVLLVVVGFLFLRRSSRTVQHPGNG